MNKNKKNSQSGSAGAFYNNIAGIYDKMIDFEKNLDLRGNAYKIIFPVPGKTADIGCGIGLDSIALAKNGHKVAAFDISENMISKAKENFKKYNVTADAEVASFKNITRKAAGKFNYVLSVGNTIAHMTKLELRSAIKKMNSILIPGGKIFLHILNYSLIVKQSKRVNNIANRGGHVIIRFYDFGKNDIGFNILSFPVDEPKNFKLITTKHYPHSKKEIGEYLKQAGFKKIKFTGSFEGADFDSNSSKDLFVEAVKKL